MFGINIYVIAAIGLMIASLGGYAMYERAGRAEAETKAAALAATVNELQAVHDNDVKAIAELKDAADKAAAAAVADQAQQRVIVQTVTKWRDRIINAPPRTDACNVATPRDIAVLDGVRGVLTAAVDPNPSGANPAAPGIDSGHPAAGPASNDNNAGPVGRGNAGPGGMGISPPSAPRQSPNLGQRLREALAR